MTSGERKLSRCTIYTRKSSEHGLEQDFNSLDAQREAGEAYIKSQAHEGWRLVKTAYDDGGLAEPLLARADGLLVFTRVCVPLIYSNQTSIPFPITAPSVANYDLSKLR